MRKTVVLILILMLAMGAMLAVGCGEDETETVEDEDVIVVDEPVEESVVGMFTEGFSDSGGSKSITVKADGTFEGDAWDGARQGTYEVEEGETNSIVLTFEDGSEETWSIAITMGEVAAILSPDGEQYTKKQ